MAHQSAAEYQATAYHLAARPLAHAVGTSCDNLVSLARGPLAQEQVPEPRLQQPAALVSPPDLGEALGSPQTSASLDQYAPMLPSDPVARLPLLERGDLSSSATARVAAWLLDEDVHGGSAAAANDAFGEGADSGDDCADIALLHESLECEAPGVAVAQPPATKAACREAEDDVDGYHGAASFYTAQRSSLDGFLSQRVSVAHGDALNNYVASLY